jgi:uncharacterized protein (TIGR02266 family)
MEEIAMRNTLIEQHWESARDIAKERRWACVLYLAATGYLCLKHGDMNVFGFNLLCTFLIIVGIVGIGFTLKLNYFYERHLKKADYLIGTAGFPPILDETVSESPSPSKFSATSFVFLFLYLVGLLISLLLLMQKNNFDWYWSSPWHWKILTFVIAFVLISIGLYRYNRIVLNRADQLKASGNDTSRLFELVNHLAWEFEEKRAHPRKPCFANVDYATRTRFFNDFIINISKGGVFIETRESFAVGTEISLVFTLSANPEPVKITGKIVRTSPQGIGIKFNEESVSKIDD